MLWLHKEKKKSITESDRYGGTCISITYEYYNEEIIFICFKAMLY